MNKTGWLTQQQEIMIPTKETHETSMNMTYSMERLLQETRDLRRKLNEREVNQQIHNTFGQDTTINNRS